MSPGPTFDRIYVALKQELARGRFAPGDHLEPAGLGEELNASITPVRDALHRLVGERLVEAPRNDGFRVPAPTEAELRDLYGWNWELLDLGLRARRGAAGTLSRPPALEEPVEGDRSSAVADLFLRIAARSGNPEHEAAVATLNDRLSPIRTVEAQLFEDLDVEVSALRSAFGAQDWSALRRSIAAYHRRRQRSVPDLLRAARAVR
jgi:hypothetical protein